MNYIVTRTTSGTPWLINALLALRHAHLAEWQAFEQVMFEPIPESAYCKWWYAAYGSVLTYEVDLVAMTPGKWTVDFADEKEYLMFILRWA